MRVPIRLVESHVLARIAAVVLLVSSVTLATEPESAAEKAVAGTLDAWAAAYTADDPGRIVRFYEKSRDLHLVLSGGRDFTGFDAVEAMYDEAAKEVRFTESKLSDVAVRVRGDVAWARARHRARFVVRSDGSKLRLVVRTTFVLVRTGDTWRIAAEHSSPIEGIDRLQPDE